MGLTHLGSDTSILKANFTEINIFVKNKNKWRPTRTRGLTRKTIKALELLHNPLFLEDLQIKKENLQILFEVANLEKVKINKQ